MSHLGISGHRSWTSYHAGSAPIILTAPHGGPSKPFSVPSRSREDLPPSPLDTFSTKNDIYTLELVQDLAAALDALGARPHVVCNLLSRSKLDPNRSASEACTERSEARLAYEDYHAFIGRAAAAGDFPHPRLLLDVHGHNKRRGLVEMGYRLPAAQLRSGRFKLADSSLAALADSRHSPAALLVGGASLGAQIAALWPAEVVGGLEVAPGGGGPPLGEHYFSGGFTLRRWAGPGLAAIQMEVGVDLREPGPRREAFVEVLANALMKFVEVVKECGVVSACG